MINSKGIFQTIGKKDRLVDRVVNEIQRLIVENKLKPGERLPPEREFAEQVGVSRTVVREAVQILVTKGLLETKHGIGNIIRKMNSDQLAEPLDILLKTNGYSLEDLHQVRTILEVEIASIAATQASEDDIGLLEKLLLKMESEKENLVNYSDTDKEFHIALTCTTHNPLLMMLSKTIGELMLDAHLSVLTFPDLQVLLPDHRRIFESIKNKDAEGARKIMKSHLEHAHQIQQQCLSRNS